MKKLNSFFVIPAYTFFYWGFTLPAREYKDFIKFFGLKKGLLTAPVEIKIGGKFYDARVKLTRQISDKYAKRDVISIFYKTEYDTLKALRKLFIFSYASTIDKKKPKLKEMVELIHLGKNRFRMKVISKQETDFDDMFKFMEEKNLFQYWQNAKAKNSKSIFVDYSRKWISADDVSKYKNRSNVIYILHNKNSKQLYVGKANMFGSRVKKGSGRIGLNSDWDKFMFFEIDPDYAHQLEQIEAFAIRILATVMDNDVKMKPLGDAVEKLVNRQLKKK